MAGERAAPAAWVASGAAVPLLDARDGDLTLLLERLRPGTPLEAAPIDGDRRLRILAEVAARLHAATPTIPTGLVSLADLCAEWRRDLARHPTELDELDALLASTAEETVLHGDLHGENVLLYQGRWVAIDPNAARGDPNAEIWPLINPASPVLGAEPDEVRASLATYASVAGLDPERAGRWARIRAIAEAEYIDRGDFDDEDRAWAVGLRRFGAAIEPS